MSKKSKKIGNVWDLTPEEQQKQLDEFAEFEKGNVDIMSLIGNKSMRGVDENGFSAGLEAIILKDQKKLDNNYDDEPVHGLWSTSDSHCSESDDYDNDTAIAPKVNIIAPKVYQDQYAEDVSNIVNSAADTNDNFEPDENPSVNNNPVYHDEKSVREYSIKINEDLATLHRLIIDDGICPTVVSLDVAKSENIDHVYDAENAGNACVELSQYIMTLKHPSAIFEMEDFFNTDYWKFGRVLRDDYNKNRYAFFSVGNYVLCYLIDTESINVFNQLINTNYSHTIEEILKIYLSLAYAAGTLHQAFWVEDDDYIKRIFNDKNLNKQSEFHDIFVSDLSTKLVPPHDSVDVDDGVRLIPVEDLQINARDIMSDLSGNDYYDNYDDEDDEEEDDIPSNPNNTKQIMNDEYSDLADGMDFVDEKTSINENSSHDQILEYASQRRNQDNESVTLKHAAGDKLDYNDTINDDLVFPVIKKNS